MPRTIRQSVDIAAWTLFALAFAFVAYHYVVVKKSYFDDVFIYLHMARNGVEAGTWQYFPVVERSALLASSPFKLVILTVATGIAHLVGFAGRTVEDAEFVLLCAGFLGWLVFLPFWRDRLTQYAVAGAIYFLSATAFSSAFDFEGGLLFLWVLSLAAVLTRPIDSPRSLALLLPIGGLIRPDLALIVYAILLGMVVAEPRIRERLLSVSFGWLFAIPAVWVALSLTFSVYPIPVTYWTKASIPRLFEDATLLQLVFERLGTVMAAPSTFSRGTATIVGALVLLLAMVLALSRTSRPVLVGAVAVLATVLLFGRLPASSWWYYDNILLVVLALLCLNIAQPVGDGAQAVRIASATLLFVVLGLAVGTKAFRDQPGLWSFDEARAGRAQGYLFLARNANGDGSYTLPQVGRVLVKNPEMGIISYFSGRGAWIWDGAGLAQPMDVREVKQSLLRYAYPTSLRQDAINDAATLVNRLGQTLPVVEVWGMEDRDFDKARKVCQQVIVEGALCVNPFRIIAPSR
jgi:hypothetical protein